MQLFLRTFLTVKFYFSKTERESQQNEHMLLKFKIAYYNREQGRHHGRTSDVHGRQMTLTYPSSGNNPVLPFSG